MSDKRAAESSASTDPDAPPAKKQRLLSTDASKASESKTAENTASSSATPSTTATTAEAAEEEDIDIKLNEKRIVFLTGNLGKLKEVQSFFDKELGSLISNKKLDLEETQGTPKDIIAKKLFAARQELGKNTSILVEDTSLMLNAYSPAINPIPNNDKNKNKNKDKNDNANTNSNNENSSNEADLVGMPGPYIKWLLKWDKEGNEGLCKMARGLDDNSAFALCIFGFLPNNSDTPIYFGGKCDGIIPAKPQCGESGFGWDPVFVPNEGQADENNKKSFAQMSTDDKNKISHRGKALVKFKKYLETEYMKDVKTDTNKNKNANESKEKTKE